MNWRSEYLAIQFNNIFDLGIEFTFESFVWTISLITKDSGAMPLPYENYTVMVSLGYGVPHRATQIYDLTS